MVHLVSKSTNKARLYPKESGGKAVKTRLLKFPFASSSIETIDFKKFCAGGSPEYIRAKKILAECGLHKSAETFKIEKSYNDAIIGDIEDFEVLPVRSALKFKESTKPCHPQNAKLRSAANGKFRSLTAYSLYINPFAFFDVHFMLIAGTVVLVAVLERAIAQSGMIEIASLLSSALKIAFPMVAIGSIIYLIGHTPIFF